MTKKEDQVTRADLVWAADWMVGASDDASVLRARRVAAWIEAEIDRRADEVRVRELVRQYGLTPAQARVAVRGARSRWLARNSDQATEGPEA